MPAADVGLARPTTCGRDGTFDEALGSRCPDVDDKVIRAHFIYHGLRFATAAEPSDRGTRVTICGCLGHVPFSVQSGVGRAAVLTFLRVTGGRLPRGRLHVTPKKEIFVEGVFDSDAVPTAMTLVAASAIFIAANRPYIDLFVEYSPTLPKPYVTRRWLGEAATRRATGGPEPAGEAPGPDHPDAIVTEQPAVSASLALR
jgi:hypothetical protein